MKIAAAALAALGAGSAQAAPKTSVLTLADYHGWPGVYRLTNGKAQAVVVPGIGRVMEFTLAGQPDTNPLWENPAWRGKLLPSQPGEFPKEWANYGGMKVWPSEQSQWPKHQPSGWPPDPHISDGPFTVIRIKNGLRLTGPISPYYAVRLVEDITLPPGKAELHFHETFFKAKDASGDKDGFPIGIWTIAQTRGDETVYLPANQKGGFPEGYYTFTDTFTPQPNWTLTGDLLEITRNPKDSTKVGTDSSAGWLASLYGGNVLFVERFKREKGRAYPDHNTNAQVYTNASAEAPYIEMETLGPLVDLKAGQKIGFDVTWRLQRLPRTPKDAADARRLVAASASR